MIRIIQICNGCQAERELRIGHDGRSADIKTVAEGLVGGARSVENATSATSVSTRLLRSRRKNRGHNRTLYERKNHDRAGY